MSDRGENKLINLLFFVSIFVFALCVCACVCVCTCWYMNACRVTRISPVCLEPSDDGTTRLLSALVKIPSFPSFAFRSALHFYMFLHSLCLRVKPTSEIFKASFRGSQSWRSVNCVPFNIMIF